MVGTGLADRVKESSTTTGTGTFTLDGAVTGYRTFLSAFTTGSPCAYVIQMGANWEVGIGIITSPDQLSRESVLQSSNSGAAVNWAAGTKDVFGARIAASTDSDVYIAGESISVRDALYLELAGGARTIGRVFKANATNHSTSIQAVFVGFATHAASVGKPILTKRSGELGGFTSLTVGANYYISNTAGAITTSAPANAVIVATALTTTEIFIHRPEYAIALVADDNTGNNIGVIGHGMYGNGRSGSSGSILKGNSFDYIDLLSMVGNAASRGTTSPATSSYGVVGSSTKGYFCGGAIGTTTLSLESSVSIFDRYLAIGNAVDTGDLTLARCGLAGVSGSARGFIAGGLSASGYSDVIDLLTFATFTTTTSDAGDLLLARNYIAGCSTAGKGFFAGGENSGYQSLIDMVDLATGAQNATDRGDLSERKSGCAGLSGAEPTIGGGYNGHIYSSALEQIDSLTYSVVSLNRGELSMPRAFLAAAGLSTAGVFAAGSNGIETNLIETLDPAIGVTNVSNRGTTSYARSGCSGL
jgi:hypothetical protein